VSILKFTFSINRPDLKLRPYLVDLDHILAIIIRARKEVVFAEGISETPKLQRGSEELEKGRNDIGVT
jgi:hypothetical protein